MTADLLKSVQAELVDALVKQLLVCHVACSISNPCFDRMCWLEEPCGSYGSIDGHLGSSMATFFALCISVVWRVLHGPKAVQ